MVFMRIGSNIYRAMGDALRIFDVVNNSILRDMLRSGFDLKTGVRTYLVQTLEIQRAQALDGSFNYPDATSGVAANPTKRLRSSSCDAAEEPNQKDKRRQMESRVERHDRSQSRGTSQERDREGQLKSTQANPNVSFGLGSAPREPHPERSTQSQDRYTARSILRAPSSGPVNESNVDQIQPDVLPNRLRITVERSFRDKHPSAFSRQGSTMTCMQASAGSLYASACTKGASCSHLHAPEVARLPRLTTQERLVFFASQGFVRFDQPDIPRDDESERGSASSRDRPSTPTREPRTDQQLTVAAPR